MQAVGRALRPAQGKKFGYVIVPVISRGENAEEFVESPAFASVLTILRSLAANDERIIEYFRAIHSGRSPKGTNVDIDVEEKLGRVIDLNRFEEGIKTNVWNRLARLSWRSFEEAALYVDQPPIGGPT